MALKQRKTQNSKASSKAQPDPRLEGVEIPRHFYKKWVGNRDALVKVRTCDHPDCGEKGEFRAPKSRASLEDYYWFCLEHVRAYNAQWDYYKGMNALEIENALRFQAVWERPSWPFAQNTKNHDRKAKSAFRHFWEEDDNEEAEAMHARAASKSDPRFKAELEALRELGLFPPVDFAVIKKRYRALVKRHHPDVKKGDEAEEKIKRLNAAFTLLKSFYAMEEV